MSNTGLEGEYQRFQDVPITQEKQIDIEKIYSKLITHNKKDINLMTDIPDSYSLVVMESISDYLYKKYGTSTQDKKLIKIMCSPINNFVEKYKSLNPSVNGKRASEVLSSLSKIVDNIKNRNTIQKLTGTGDKIE